MGESRGLGAARGPAEVPWELGDTISWELPEHYHGGQLLGIGEQGGGPHSFLHLLPFAPPHHLSVSHLAKNFQFYLPPWKYFLELREHLVCLGAYGEQALSCPWQRAGRGAFLLPGYSLLSLLPTA